MDDIPENLAKIALLPDGEFNRALAKVQEFEAAVSSAVRAIKALREYLGVPIKSLDDEEVVKNLSLCYSCANPCDDMTDTKVDCRKYSQLTDKCSSCAYWDVNTCQFAGDCYDGSNHVELGNPGPAQESGVAV